MDAKFWDAITIILLVVGAFAFFWYQQRQATKRIEQQIKDGTLGEVAIRQMMNTVRKVQREDAEKEQRKN